MNPFGVTVGAILGHCFCTGLAVLGGHLIAKRISQRAVAATGGLLFFTFAFIAAIYGAPGVER
jgi:putative Ca2+/H+ antiporter (TMEM165/GDT1 family)